MSAHVYEALEAEHSGRSLFCYYHENVVPPFAILRDSPSTFMLGFLASMKVRGKLVKRSPVW